MSTDKLLFSSMSLSCFNFTASKKWMAMKTCDIAEYRKHTTGLKLIENELHILSHIEESTVKHPNINRFHFAFHDKTSLYMAFDLQTCGDLRLLLQHRKRPLSERCVAFIAICMADALTHLHARGILHRDVKPENILLDEAGFPHLTDFGVSYIDTQAGRELQCTLGSGTREYLAPEVLGKARLHGAEADFWSLGVVLFELLFRVRPFEKRCPTHFVRLANYFHKYDAVLTSTGSKYSPSPSPEEEDGGSSQRRPQLEPPTALTASSSSSPSSSPPTSSTSVFRARVPAEYHFSTAAHQAYVAATVSSNRELSIKLSDLKFQAYGERAPRSKEGQDASSPPPPPMHTQADTDINNNRAPPASGSGSASGSGRPEKIPYVPDFMLELPAAMRVTVMHPFRRDQEEEEEDGEGDGEGGGSSRVKGSEPPAVPAETSQLCADVVGRLLDPRVWRRLGGGANFQPMQQHAWFRDLGLSWEEVVAGKCASPIHMDKHKLNLYFSCQHLFGEGKRSYEDLEISFPPLLRKPLSAEEKKVLEDFYYISPTYCTLSSSSVEGVAHSGGTGSRRRVADEEKEEEEDMSSSRTNRSLQNNNKNGNNKNRNNKNKGSTSNKVSPASHSPPGASPAAEVVVEVEAESYSNNATEDNRNNDHNSTCSEDQERGRKFSLKAINKLLSKHSPIDVVVEQ